MPIRFGSRGVGAMPPKDSAANRQWVRRPGLAKASAVDNDVNRAAGNGQEAAVEVPQQEPGGIDLGGERPRRDAPAPADAGTPAPAPLVVPAPAEDQGLDQRVQPRARFKLQRVVRRTIGQAGRGIAFCQGGVQAGTSGSG